MSNQIKIAVIGTGYVGLVSGACLAELGNEVVCVDINQDKIAQLSDGKIPFYEPGLEELVRNNIARKHLRFSSDIKSSMAGIDLVFIAVGTPANEDGSSNLSYLVAAVQDVINSIENDLVLVIKSTVPVGTNERLKSLVALGTHKITLASNPEFLKEGDAVNDFMEPDRVIIGVEDKIAEVLLERLYKPLMLRENRLMVMDIKSAELTKYAANAMLAVRVSFMNEMAGFCDKVGANIDFIRKGIGSDERIGNRFLYAGVGWGGSCWEKDCSSLIFQGRKVGLDMKMVSATQKVNKNQFNFMIETLEKKLGFNEMVSGKPKPLTIGVWGLAFKPRTDDIREAPAVHLLKQILEVSACVVKAYDRAAMNNVRAALPANLYPNLILVQDEYAAVDGADALVLMTEWAEFRAPDWKDIKKKMRGNLVLDGRNIWEPAKVKAFGFDYVGVGRS